MKLMLCEFIGSSPRKFMITTTNQYEVSKVIRSTDGQRLEIRASAWANHQNTPNIVKNVYRQIESHYGREFGESEAREVRALIQELSDQLFKERYGKTPDQVFGAGNTHKVPSYTGRVRNRSVRSNNRKRYA